MRECPRIHHATAQYNMRVDTSYQDQANKQRQEERSREKKEELDRQNRANSGTVAYVACGEQRTPVLHPSGTPGIQRWEDRESPLRKSGMRRGHNRPSGLHKYRQVRLACIIQRTPWCTAHTVCLTYGMAARHRTYIGRATASTHGPLVADRMSCDATRSILSPLPPCAHARAHARAGTGIELLKPERNANGHPPELWKPSPVDYRIKFHNR